MFKMLPSHHSKKKRPRDSSKLMVLDRIKGEVELEKLRAFRTEKLHHASNHLMEVHHLLEKDVRYTKSLFSHVHRQIVEHNLLKRDRESERKKKAIDDFSFLKSYVSRAIRWSTQSKSKEIKLKLFKATSTRYGWKTLFTSTPLVPSAANSSGEYEISILLRKYMKNQLAFIGLVDLQKYVSVHGNKFNDSISKIGYCLDLSSGNIVHGISNVKYMKPVPRVGDVVKIYYNQERRHLSFGLVADSDCELKYGLAFKKAKGILHLAVSFFNAGQTFELLDKK